MTSYDAMHRIDTLLAHVWMVRTFVKHSDEAAEDEQLQEVYRELYDFSLSLGAAWKDQDATAYLRQAHKKYRKLKAAAELFVQIQPEISTHTNFQMAARSLSAAVAEIGVVLETFK
jgi:cob(I)alamin adenosyltransferase